MSTIDQVVQRAAELLHDSTHDRWTMANLVDWCNAGIQEALVFRPTAYTEKLAIPLVEGAVQTLPSEHFQFMRPLYTTKADSTKGRTPALVDFVSLSMVDPSWMNGTPNEEVEQVAPDPASAHTFYTYPPQPAATTATLEAIVATQPAYVTPSDDFPLATVFEPAIVDFMLYRAYSMEAEFASEEGRAGMHYNAFKSAIRGR